MTESMLQDLAGFLKDAEEATTGLRPEDAIIAIRNAQATVEYLQDESAIGD